MFLSKLKRELEYLYYSPFRNINMATKYKIPKIEDLLEAGVHFGHQVKRWHPSMEPYIYTVNKNIHIIDLEQTVELLKQATDFLYKTARSGGKIIFVGTKKQAREIVRIESDRCGSLYIIERWLGGTITNFDVIKKNNIDKLIDLKRRKEAGELKKYTKKERLMIDREIEKLERYVGGISSLTGLPAALFVIDVKRENTAVREARKAGIPVVGFIDTNSDPSLVDYPIPGNDDAIKSIASIVKVISNAIEEGYREFAKGGKTPSDKSLEQEVESGSSKKETEKKVEKEVEKAKPEKEEPKKTPSAKTSPDKSKVKPKEAPSDKSSEQAVEDKPKKRGRPKKTTPLAKTSSDKSKGKPKEVPLDKSSEQKVEDKPKKRGRPKKSK